MIEHLLENDAIRRDGIVVLSGDVQAERALLAYETMTPGKAPSILGEAKTLFVDEAATRMSISFLTIPRCRATLMP